MDDRSESDCGNDFDDRQPREQLANHSSTAMVDMIDLSN